MSAALESLPPQPWKVGGSALDSCWSVYAADGRRIATGIDIEPTADLMAAAPELLAALQGFLLGAKSEATVANVVGEDVVREARAAIARALKP